VAPEVLEALSKPVMSHLEPEFLRTLDDVSAGLMRLFDLDDGLAIPLSGTGSMGMEATVANFVAPGTRVVVAVNGEFGRRIAEMASRYGARVTEVGYPWGQPFDPEEVAEQAERSRADIVYAVHAETSTGVLNDVARLGRLKGEWLYVVDCVTSLGGEPFSMREWSIDVAYSATQKCLSVPPGLSPIALSSRALDRVLDRPRSWYMDLRLISQYAAPGSQRRYHHTAPTSMVRALQAGLRLVFSEGLDRRTARHSMARDLLVERLSDLGLEMFAPEGYRAAPLTAVVLPPGMEAAEERSVRARLLEEHGIEIGGGLGELSGRIWRIGLMGVNATEESVERLSEVLGKLLADRQ
jgi:alanine-glyoxylate transaminase/serine-glyoxylate transaminase/serine-pyruvate transaminase